MALALKNLRRYYFSITNTHRTISVHLLGCNGFLAPSREPFLWLWVCVDFDVPSNETCQRDRSLTFVLCSMTTYQCIKFRRLATNAVQFYQGKLYTLNHKKRDILFLTITLANLNRFSQFLYHFNRE